ncbi:hypothetical protein BH09SUM1_BH09SUM1_22950 [soil metagenome]
MDYDSIAKGRRRNWDKLKPDDMRRREREEERARKEAELEKSGKKRNFGFFEFRRRLLDKAAEEDYVRYVAAVKQATILGGAFVLVIMVWLGVEMMMRSHRKAENLKRLDSYELMLSKKKVIDDFLDPIAAFESWRSAWQHEDVVRVIGMMSSVNFGRMSASKDRNDILTEYRNMKERGALKSSVEVAEGFTYADIINLPGKPWHDKDLASFRSGEITLSSDPSTSREYVASFSYHETSKTWKFADVREAQYFSVKWDSEAMLTALQAGPRAVRYDEDGEILQPAAK